MRRVCALAVAVIAVVAVPMAGAAAVPVSITPSGYVPSAVTAANGDTVQFKNDDAVAHQVAFVPSRAVTCSPSPFTLQPGQSGNCVLFTAAAALFITFSDPTVAGSTFQGTLTLTAPPPPDTLTLLADPRSVVYSSKVHMTGELSSKKAGVDVVLLARPCGKTKTESSTVQTTAGGAFSVELRTARNTVYAVHAGNTSSPDVRVKVEPRLRLGRVSAHRYSLRVFAAESFAGRYATFQRFTGTRWVSVMRVGLQKNSTNIAPTVISSAAFTWTSTSRPRVRAILSQSQAGGCYVPGTSNDIRS